MLRHKEDFALLALGSNASTVPQESYQKVTSALAQLANHNLGTIATGMMYKTKAFPVGSGPDFINCVARVELNSKAVSPIELMTILHQIESDLGRVRQERWGQRAIDIDLISFGDQVRPNQSVFDHWMNLDFELQKNQTPSELILPHPRIQDRAFVLVPLADIAPDWVHPVLGLTTLEMLSRLPQELRDEVVEYNPTN